MSLFQPCERTSRSVIASALINCPDIGRDGRVDESRLLVELHLDSGKSRDCRHDTPRFRASDRLDCAHEIDEARALKVAVPAEVCRRADEDALHLLRPADELPADG